jgi:hypothetical protein
MRAVSKVQNCSQEAPRWVIKSIFETLLLSDEKKYATFTISAATLLPDDRKLTCVANDNSSRVLFSNKDNNSLLSFSAF